MSSTTNSNPKETSSSVVMEVKKVNNGYIVIVNGKPEVYDTATAIGNVMRTEVKELRVDK